MCLGLLNVKVSENLLVKHAPWVTLLLLKACGTLYYNSHTTLNMKKLNPSHQDLMTTNSIRHFLDMNIRLNSCE